MSHKLCSPNVLSFCQSLFLQLKLITTPSPASYTCLFQMCVHSFSIVSGEIYTSDSLGNDESGDGSAEKPFKTVLQVCQWLTHTRSLFLFRARAGIRQLSQWLKKTKIGSRKIKLAQEKSNWLKPPKSTTFRIHCASIIKRSYIRGLRVFSKYFSSICVKMSVDDRGIHNANCENRTPCVFPSQV